MNIAITGGGTGGHLSIAKAIKEELNSRGIDPIFIGSSYGQDEEWFSHERGFSKKCFFDTTAVVNKKIVAKIFSLGNILKYSFKCKSIFKKNEIDIVFSVGGYSAAPASFASILYDKKLFIHEQNAIMGRLNKLLAPFASEVFSSYQDKSSLKYYPIRTIFFKNARVRESVKTVIFLGGSQGATAINNYAMKVAKELTNRGIKIIHQSGKRDYQKLKDFYKSENIEVDLFDFSDHLEDKIKEADFAVSRAGASTLWELSASGVPALYIPYPYAAANHQYFNARFLVDKKYSFVKDEKFLRESDLFDALSSDISAMSRGLKEITDPNGAKEIVDKILSTIVS